MTNEEIRKYFQFVRPGFLSNDDLTSVFRRKFDIRVLQWYPDEAGSPFPAGKGGYSIQSYSSNNPLLPITDPVWKVIFEEDQLDDLILWLRLYVPNLETILRTYGET